MSLSFQCPCGRVYQVAETLAGKVVVCKGCRQKIRVPVPGPDFDGLDEGPPAPPPRMRPAAAPSPVKRTGQPIDWSRSIRRVLEFIPVGYDTLLVLLLIGVGLFVAMMLIRTGRRGDPAANEGGGPLPSAVAGGPKAQAPPANLTEARRGFATRLIRRGSDREPIETPPPNIFETVRYPSAVGPLGAYLTPDPGDGAKHPAIVWITGGDCNSIGDVWKTPKSTNDQTAAAYRKSGIIMMFPSLRGGNDNPGQKEGFLGEVDDVLAATDELAKRPYVDPSRIYLGGHSTGGTLALLVAESTDRYRAVFSFGPVDNVRGYGPEYLPFDTSNPREIRLRSPIDWLSSVRCPTFVFEGTTDGNLPSLRSMQRASKNPLLHFYPVDGADHFTILAPTNRLLAAYLLRDDGPSPGIVGIQDQLNLQFRR